MYGAAWLVTPRRERRQRWSFQRAPSIACGTLPVAMKLCGLHAISASAISVFIAESTKSDPELSSQSSH